LKGTAPDSASGAYIISLEEIPVNAGEMTAKGKVSVGSELAVPLTSLKGLLSVHSRQKRSYIERPVWGTYRTFQ
jgi:hypothetical protein